MAPPITTAISWLKELFSFLSKGRVELLFGTDGPKFNSLLATPSVYVYKATVGCSRKFPSALSTGGWRDFFKGSYSVVIFQMA